MYVQGNTSKRVLYVSIALMDKMCLDGSLSERARAYEKMTKNCRFCHERSRNVEIVAAQISFALLNFIRLTKKLASTFHGKSGTALFFWLRGNSFYLNRGRT